MKNLEAQLYYLVKELFSIIWGIVRFVLIGTALIWVLLLTFNILFGASPFSFFKLFWFMLGFGWVWAWGETLHSFRWSYLVTFIFAALIWHIVLFQTITFNGSFLDIDHCLDIGGAWREDRCITSQEEWEAILEKEVR